MGVQGIGEHRQPYAWYSAIDGDGGVVGSPVGLPFFVGRWERDDVLNAQRPSRNPWSDERAVARCLEAPGADGRYGPLVVDQLLMSGELRCPGCGGELRPWGYARGRGVREEHAIVVSRPRRSCCSRRRCATRRPAACRCRENLHRQGETTACSNRLAASNEARSSRTLHRPRKRRHPRGSPHLALPGSPTAGTPDPDSDHDLPADAARGCSCCPCSFADWSPDRAVAWSRHRRRGR